MMTAMREERPSLEASTRRWRGGLGPRNELAFSTLARGHLSRANASVGGPSLARISSKEKALFERGESTLSSCIPTEAAAEERRETKKPRRVCEAHSVASTPGGAAEEPA